MEERFKNLFEKDKCIEEAEHLMSQIATSQERSIKQLSSDRHKQNEYLLKNREHRLAIDLYSYLKEFANYLKGEDE